MWKIYKHDSEDLAFSLDCLFYQAITIDEFKLWLYIVLRDTNIESLPNYFFDLVNFDKDLFHITNIIGFVPHEKLSEEERKAICGIAYLRNVRSLYDIGVDRAVAIKALERHSNISEQFNKFFPFIELNI